MRSGRSTGHLPVTRTVDVLDQTETVYRPICRDKNVEPDVALGRSSVDEGVAGGGFATSRLGRVALRAEGSARRSGNVRTPPAR